MSERRMAQPGRGRDAFHASDEHFRGMIENAPVPIFINRDDRIHFINRAATLLLRAQSPQQLVGQSVFDIFHPEVHERMRGRIAALREQPGSSVPAAQERVVTVDGVAIDVEVAAMSYRVDGHLDIQVVARDVTELRRAEREVRELNATLEQRVAERTRELDQANRAKSDFLANMSHELRTPLNSIIGFSEMLRDGVLGDLEARQREFVDDIFDAGTHLLALINDILDLSKVEAGMLQLETDAVDIVALVRSSTLVVREKAAASRIRVDTQLESGLASLAADERKLKQILYNLLSNAVKFTSPGGAGVAAGAALRARGSGAGQGDARATAAAAVRRRWGVPRNHGRGQRFGNCGGEPGPVVRAVHAGGQLGGPPACRHRAGAFAGAAARGTACRHGGGREPARGGQPLPRVVAVPRGRCLHDAGAARARRRDARANRRFPSRWSSRMTTAWRNGSPCSCAPTASG